MEMIAAINHYKWREVGEERTGEGERKEDMK